MTDDVLHGRKVQSSADQVDIFKSLMNHFFAELWWNQHRKSKVGIKELTTKCREWLESQI